MVVLAAMAVALLWFAVCKPALASLDARLRELAKTVDDAQAKKPTVDAPVAQQRVLADRAGFVPEFFDVQSADLLRLLDKGIDNLKMELIKQMSECKDTTDLEHHRLPVFGQLALTLQHEWLQMLSARIMQTPLPANFRADFSTIEVTLELTDKATLQKTRTFQKHSNASVIAEWTGLKWVLGKWNQRDLRSVFVELFDEMVRDPLRTWAKAKLGRVHDQITKAA